MAEVGDGVNLTAPFTRKRRWVGAKRRLRVNALLPHSNGPCAFYGGGLCNSSTSCCMRTKPTPQGLFYGPMPLQAAQYAKYVVPLRRDSRSPPRYTSERACLPSARKLVDATRKRHFNTSVCDDARALYFMTR